MARDLPYGLHYALYNTYNWEKAHRVLLKKVFAVSFWILAISWHYLFVFLILGLFIASDLDSSLMLMPFCYYTHPNICTRVFIYSMGSSPNL